MYRARITSSNVLSVEHRNLLRLDLGLGGGRDGKVGEPDTEVARNALEVNVIADDEPKIAGKLLAAVAEQEIIEAMVVTRHEDGDALRPLGVDQPVAHLETPAHLLDGALEREPIGLQRGQIEPDALEEHPGDRVRVLIGVEDVRAVPVEHLRERRDDAPTVGAGDEQRRELGRDHERLTSGAGVRARAAGPGAATLRATPLGPALSSPARPAPSRWRRRPSDRRAWCAG